MNHSEQLAKKFLELTKKLDLLVVHCDFEKNMPEIERILGKRSEVIQEIDALGEEKGQKYLEYLQEARLLEDEIHIRYQESLSEFGHKVKTFQNKKIQVIKGKNVRKKYSANYAQSSGVFMDKKK